MFAVKVGRVQPLVGNDAQFVVEIFALDTTYQTVRIDKAQPEMIAKFRQQAVLIELIHYEFCILQYGTTDRYGFAHQYFRFGTFHHCEVLVDDLRTLVVGF